ncbi:spore coat U domain-containing protein [Stenotrophomonas sp.]|uniref:Csu type fimbrial protein n=1 Tax=Stenotrophomonas sp. TaxID=69392 RepID=UPI0028A586D9|nr:spore coat U domain-containing protein [Stenotrophomonas sp.]
MNRFARATAFFILSLGTGEVAAACLVGGAQAADFGSVGSMALHASRQTTSTHDAGIQCSGEFHQPWGASDTYFRVTLTSANGGLEAADDLLNYQLYASADRASATALAPGVALDLAGLGVVDALGLLQSASGKAMPLYLMADAGGNVAAGNYSDTVTLAWEWRYCTAGSGGGVCASYDMGSGVSSFPVNLVVQNDCTIAAADLDFGTAALPSEFAVARGSIEVACTKGSAYSVGLGDGRSLLAGRRHMRSVQGEMLAYDLFQGGGSVRWGSVGGQRRASTAAEVNPGNGLGIGKQVFKFSGKVYPDQAPVPAGSYVDTVLIDVAF